MVNAGLINDCAKADVSERRATAAGTTTRTITTKRTIIIKMDQQARGMPVWAQWLGTILPVTHMLRVVRGSVLKGVGLGDQLGNLGALALFVLVVAGLAIKQYRTTLD